MHRTRQLRWLLWAVAVVVAAAMTNFAVERGFMLSHFDRLESAQVAHDFERLRVALDYEVRLLANFGSTNSIWDSSFDDVQTGNAKGFATDFDPAQVRQLYGLDGVVGVSADGRPTAGGVISAANTYLPLPAVLNVPGVLRSLYAAQAGPGVARCGVVSGEFPFLFCGFATHRTDGSGSGVDGLVFLRSLDPAGLAALGTRMDMPVRLVGSAAGRVAGRGLHSALGMIDIHVRPVSADQLTLDATIPTVSGGRIVLQAVQPRPIHELASGAVVLALLLMVGTGAVLLVVVLVLVRRGIRAQVGPLRRTAEAVIASGNHGLRIGLAGRGEIPALAAVIDRMLAVLAQQEAELNRRHGERERALHEGFTRRNAALQQLTMKDPLTATGNRTALARALTTDLSETADGGLLLLLDLDAFKAVNDTYGHAVGDLVLREVTRRFMKVTRGEDTLARLGGDEFAAWLPGIGTEDLARRVVDRLLQACRQPMAIEDLVLTVTVSIGMVLRRPSDVPEALLGRADKALYQAKRAGRDRYVLYDERLGEAAGSPQWTSLFSDAAPDDAPSPV